jgi:ABC-type amino acid transport substrate-binding protein
MIYSAEAGSAWTQLYPHFTVAIPSGITGKAPSALALPPGDASFQVYVNTWLELADKNGLLNLLYEYWILGEEHEAKTPRWSIMHNVLGWGR